MTRLVIFIPVCSTTRVGGTLLSGGSGELRDLVEHLGRDLGDGNPERTGSPEEGGRRRGEPWKALEESAGSGSPQQGFSRGDPLKLRRLRLALRPWVRTLLLASLQEEGRG